MLSLIRKCSKDHTHFSPSGGGLAATSSYPPALCRALAKIFLADVSGDHSGPLAAYIFQEFADSQTRLQRLAGTSQALEKAREAKR